MRATLAIDLKTAVAAPDGRAKARSAADLDRGLVERFLAGERRAFDELVRRHQKQIYFLCFRYLRNEADAKDVGQRVFVKAFQALAKFRGDSLFRTWLYRIAINMSLNYLRDNRREQPTEIPDNALTTSPTGPMRIIGDQDAAALRAAIDELPPKQRMVLELRVYDELPFREVAELADCTENAAKVNFHHAVKRLRALLKKESP